MSYFSKLGSFEKYMKEMNDDKFLDYEESKKLTDKEVKSIVYEKLNGRDLGKAPKDERDVLIRDIYNLTGASIRQLSTIMAINRGIIDRAIKM